MKRDLFYEAHKHFSKLKTPDEYKWRYGSPLMLYCVMNYALQTYLVILVCIRRYNALIDKSHDKINYDELIFTIHVLVYLSIHFHVPFTYWFQGPKFAEYLNIWGKFQIDWYETFGYELTLSFKKVVFIIIFTVIPSVILLLVFQKYSTLCDPWHYLMPYFFTIVSTMLVLGLWYCTCIENGQLANKMIDQLVVVVENNPNIKFIRDWKNLWISLSNLTAAIGNNLSLIFIPIFLTFSATFLLGLYNALSHILKPAVTSTTIGYLSASAMSCTIIYLFCNAGHQATAEVDLLISSIQASPLQIQLAGFVTVNRALFIGFLSNALTYLVVILQFKVAT